MDLPIWVSYSCYVGLACCLLAITGSMFYRMRRKRTATQQKEGAVNPSPLRHQPGVASPYVYSADAPWGLLEYRNGKFLGQELVLKRSIVSIGREEDNEVWLDDDTISRYHAELAWDHGKVYITDNDSLNGVLLNGRRVRTSMQVNSGDVLEIGSLRFALKYTEEARDLSDPLLPQLERMTRNRGGAGGSAQNNSSDKKSLAAPTVALEGRQEDFLPFTDEDVALPGDSHDISKQPTVEMLSLVARAKTVRMPLSPIPPVPPGFPQPMRLPSKAKE